jgi:hypothetical protein
MASKTIFDTPALLEETLVPLAAACKCFPGNPSLSAVQRWARKGSRGATLETILLCGRRYTSREAIARFIRGQLQVEAERPASARGTMSKKDVEAVARRFGLPEPQGSRKQETKK